MKTVLTTLGLTVVSIDAFAYPSSEFCYKFRSVVEVCRTQNLDPGPRNDQGVYPWYEQIYCKAELRYQPASSRDLRPQIRIVTVDSDGPAPREEVILE